MTYLLNESIERFTNWHKYLIKYIVNFSDIQAYYNIVKEHSNSGALGSTSEIYSTSENTSKSPLLDVIETIPLTDEELSVTQNTSPRNLTDVPESSDAAAALLSITIPETETEVTHLSTTAKTASTIPPAPLLTTPAMGSLAMALPPTLSILPRNISTNSTKSALPAFEYIAPTTQQQLHHHHHHQHQHHNNHPPTTSDFPLMEFNRVGVGVGMGGGGNSAMFSAFMHRRPRGEKRPIPDEQKDDKYYERRKRNNEAAKKSRDARKIREDRIAFRAALLEQENSILRAQVMALRDELQTMRQLINSGATTAARSSLAQI